MKSGLDNYKISDGNLYDNFKIHGVLLKDQEDMQAINVNDEVSVTLSNAYGDGKEVKIDQAFNLGPDESTGVSYQLIISSDLNAPIIADSRGNVMAIHSDPHIDLTDADGNHIGQANFKGDITLLMGDLQITIHTKELEDKFEGYTVVDTVSVYRENDGLENDTYVKFKIEGYDQGAEVKVVKQETGKVAKVSEDRENDGTVLNVGSGGLTDLEIIRGAEGDVGKMTDQIFNAKSAADITFANDISFEYELHVIDMTEFIDEGDVEFPNIVDSHSKNIFKKIDGSGNKNSPFTDDGRIGMKELSKAGITNQAEKKFLREFLADGDRFLSLDQFTDAIESGLLTMTEDKLELTPEGKEQMQQWRDRQSQDINTSNSGSRRIPI